MKKKAIPAIHVPIQNADGSMQWVWYMFFQWIAENAGAADLSDYFTKEEVNALLDEKVTITDEADKIYGTDNEGEQYFYDLSYFAADDNVVHKSGNEDIDGIKTFNTAPRLKKNLTPSTTTTKPSVIEDALLDTSLNTSGIIDGAGIIRMQRMDGKREVRYRAGFRNTTNTGNLWPGVSVGVNPDNTTYVDLSTSNNDYNYAKTPTDSDAKNIQIATTLWAYRNRSTYTTNCITEIPQNINLTLSNGTLTLKVGSKIRVPNGAGVFNEVTLTADKTATQTTNDTRLYFYNGSYIEKFPIAQCFSGSSAPSGYQYMFWYDTTNNVVKKTSNSGSTWESGWSLPFCIATASSGALTSIDQVFNGFGYIGSTVFVLPGVKCLAPYGRTANGTLRSYDWTCSSVIVRTETSNGKNMLAINCAQNGIGWADYVYNEKENYNYSSGTISDRRCLIGSMTIANGKIESLSIDSTFHAADFNKTANTDLSNLTNIGKNIGNWSNNVTNCITEIPQNINLTLSSGTLTLKAGSKVYVPNGAGVFDIMTISTDKSNTGNTAKAFAVTDGSSLLWSNRVSSGNTAPANPVNGTIWYDTANNLVKRYSTSSSSWVGGFSLPVACLNPNAESSTTITEMQVFNGFGYIGSTVFALPGVKGLIPNGRNADGSLKNTSFTTSSVITRTFATTENQASSAYGIDGSSFSRVGTGYYSYNEQENRNYNASATWGHVFLGYFTLTAGVVSNFTPRSAFHAVDYSDVYTKTEADNDFVHKTGKETIDGEKTFLNVIRRSAALSGNDTNVYSLTDSNNKGSVRTIAYYTGNQIYNRSISTNTTSGKLIYLDIIAKDGGNGVVTLGGNVNNIENTKTNEIGSTSDVLATKGWANNTSSNISNIAHKTGNETIAGVKKFTSEIAGTIASYAATNADSAAAPYKKIMECVLTGAHQSVTIPFLYTKSSVNLGNTTYAGKINLRTEGTAGTLSTAGSGVMLSTFPNDIQDGNYKFYIVYKNNYPETNKVTCQIWVYVKQTYAGVFVTPIRLSRGGANYSNDSFFTWGNNMDQQAALPSGYSSISQSTVTTYAKASDAINSIVTTTGISKKRNGYVKFGNGIIIQWGEVTATGTSRTITLPTAFSGVNYMVSLIPEAPSGSLYSLMLSDRTSSTFTVTSTGNAANYSFNWITVGY